MPQTVLRIGTRATRLALWQTEHIAGLIEQHADVRVEIVRMSTKGDRDQRPIPQIGTKGVFTEEIEAALRDGSVDLAVHSAKDLAARDPDGLALLVVPPREDPRDAWLSPNADFRQLPPGSVVGTSSPRRVAQLRQIRSDLTYEPLRGSVETRLAKLFDEKLVDGAVLAMAGLKRLGLDGKVRRPLSVEECVPAPGQGVLGVQGRRDDERLREMLAPLHDETVATTLACERRVVALLGAGCRAPMGVYATSDGVALHCRAVVASEDGGEVIRVARASNFGAWRSLADRVAKDLRDQGAESIIAAAD